MHISFPVLTLFLGCGEEETPKETFKNLPPFSPIIEIVPERDGEEMNEADTTTDIRVKLYPEEVMPEDPEGDSVTVRYVWLVDGELSGIEGDVVTAGNTAKGETWQVYAYANDGSLDSAPAIREITIQNARPTIGAATASPENPTTIDDLTIEVSVDDLDDADGDEVTLSYAWLKDGTSQDEYTENTLPSVATSKGEQWIVQVTPNDGTTNGSVYEEVFTIQNTLPTLSSVTLPEDATKSTSITATIIAEDIDEDELTYNYEWHVNGTAIADVTTETLEPTYFIKGDEVQLTVIANDGDGDSEALSSEVITIQNTAPVITTVTIADSQSGSTDPISRDNTVLCSSESEDIDVADTLEPSYSWSVNGTEIGTEAELVLSSLPTSTLASGDTLVCTTVVNDGSTDSEPMESSVAITNASLTLSAATLPATAGYIETVQPDYTYTDNDQDATRTFTWYKGADVSTGTLLPVPSQESVDLSALYANGDLMIGDSIFVVITLSDEDTTLEETSTVLLVTDVDVDEDTVLSANDCDDSDAMLGDVANDADCDSVLTDDDADDEDPASDSDSDGQSDLNEYICESDPLDDSSSYDTTDSDENGVADCLE